jgi:hypothetical protein
MLALMNALTDKPGWEDKVFDEEIVARWGSEAAALKDEEFGVFVEGEDGEEWDVDVDDGGVEAPEATAGAAGPPEPLHASGGGVKVPLTSDAAGFSPAMFEWCIRELRSKARLQRERRFVAVLDGAAAVLKSDVAVSEELRAELVAAAAPLEDEEPDWHPGSDGKVRDLVHPSLWPLVYGRTRVVQSELSIDDCLAAAGSGDTILVPAEPPYNKDPTRYSTKFQWLPSEVVITPDGPQFTSYINNLHPVHHARLYPVLARLFGAALPLLHAAIDRVLEWQKVDTLPVADVYTQPEDALKVQPWNRIIALTDNRECLVPELCEKAGHCDPYNYDEDDEDEDYDDPEWFDRTHPPRPHPPRPYVDVGVTSTTDPTWSRLQVIVKLANIHLTPDKPRYDGGTWHVEGLWNEHIAASALYYYDSDNITDSFLGFRTEADAELMQQMTYAYDQNEHGGFEFHYGVDPALGGGDTGLTTQYLGHVRTNQGRLLVFPNVLQHRVSPFELVDKTRPGHRKIVAIFLVDPTTPVISTARVPPQQRHWQDSTPLDARLPPELRSLVYKHINCPYAFETAADLRNDLMAERRAPDGSSAAIPAAGMYSFCEH